MRTCQTSLPKPAVTALSLRAGSCDKTFITGSAVSACPPCPTLNLLRSGATTHSSMLVTKLRSFFFFTLVFKSLRGAQQIVLTWWMNSGGGLVAKSCLTLASPMSKVGHLVHVQGFSRQEYQSGLTFPYPGDLPNPGIKPGSPALQADSLLTELPGNSLNDVSN